MKTSTHINPKVALGLEIKGWLLMLLVVLGLGSVQAQLAVVNGDFSDLTGLTGGPPWYGGAVPNGWSGFTANPYVVNNGVCNIAVLNGGDLSQAVGTTTSSGAVVLRFDNKNDFNGGGSVHVYIYDSALNELATGDFSAGLGQVLVATGVPSSETITIRFVNYAGNTGLDNVSVLMIDPNSPPLISRQPAASSVLPEATEATLSVGAIGLPPLSYQWRTNGSAISGQTDSTLSVTNPGSYTVVVTAANSLSVTSTIAQVIRTNLVPVLNGDFTSDHLSGWGAPWASLGTPSPTSGWDGSSSGGALNLDRFGIWTAFLSQYSPNYDFNLNLLAPSVVVVSFRAGYGDQAGTSITATLTVGGTPISQTLAIGQTLGTYVVAFTNGTASGDMVLGFTGSGSFLTDVSRVGFFSAADMPVIMQQPIGYQLIALGSTVNLSVQALGLPPLTYQWQTNGIALSGQTGATLTISNVTAAGAGNYTVVVTGGNGLSVTSTLARVIIPTTPPATLISDPLNATAGTALAVTTPASRGGIGAKSWQAGTNMVMNGTAVAVANAYDSGFLPFTPDAGNIYTLSCEMDIISGDWIGLAFSEFAHAEVYNGFFTSTNNLQAWMCQVVNGNYYLFTGPEIGTGISSPPVGPGANYTHTNAIVLNTAGANWTAQFFVDGAAIGGPAAYSTTPGVNPAIGYVGIGSSDNYVTKTGNTGTYQDFKLTSVLPRIIPTLSLMPQSGNLSVSWPVAAGGWVLESSPSLSSANWTPVPGVVNNSVSTPMGAGSQFFRLRSTY